MRGGWLPALHPVTLCPGSKPIHSSRLAVLHPPRRLAQNVPAEKLFTRERAASQLLDIIGRTTMEQNGRFYDWKGEEVEW